MPFELSLNFSFKFRYILIASVSGSSSAEKRFHKDIRSTIRHNATPFIHKLPHYAHYPVILPERKSLQANVSELHRGKNVTSIQPLLFSCFQKCSFCSISNLWLPSLLRQHIFQCVANYLNIKANRIKHQFAQQKVVDNNAGKCQTLLTVIVLLLFLWFPQCFDVFLLHRFQLCRQCFSANIS